MSPLLGGEFVIAFLALRIGLWMWRSRRDIGALLAGPDGPPGPEGGLPRPLAALRPVTRLAPRTAAEPAPLRRAA